QENSKTSFRKRPSESAKNAEFRAVFCSYGMLVKSVDWGLMANRSYAQLNESFWHGAPARAKAVRLLLHNRFAS
ncbi:MAG: hypothetical protein ACI9VS_003943, partial [Candidatus Binatia bacterium]